MDSSGAFNEAMCTKNGFNCSEIWTVQDKISRDLVALGRQDNHVLLIDVALPSGVPEPSFCEMIFHNQTGKKGDRIPDKIGLRSIIWEVNEEALFTSGGGTIRKWKVSKRSFQERDAAITRESTRNLELQADARVLSKVELSTASTNEWKCTEAGADEKEGPCGPWFEVETDEQIEAVAVLPGDSVILSAKSTEDAEHGARVAVATSGSNRVCKIHILAGIDKNNGTKQCTIVTDTRDGQVSTLCLYCAGVDKTLVIAGTRLGKTIVINLPENGDHDCCSDAFARERHWCSFQAHGKLAIWRCLVTPYEYIDDGVMKKTHVLITSCGDSNVKIWSIGQVLKVMDGDDPSFTMQALTTFSAHAAAVTTMHCIMATGIQEGRGLANDEVQCQNYILITGSYDGVCKRWVLGDILGNLGNDDGFQIMWRIASTSRKHCNCLLKCWENLLQAKGFTQMPQQVYRSTTLSEAIASPISWSCALCQLAVGIANAGGSPTNTGETEVPIFFGMVGPKIPFWWEYYFVCISAWIYVLLLMFDVHNWIKAKMFGILASTEGTSWKSQKKVGDLKSKLSMVHTFLWGFSQVLWMNALRFLVMAFDCTHLSKINNSENWRMTVQNMYHYEGDVMVIDEDRSVQCFEGWHVPIAVHGFILNWLYGCVSLPLLVGLGDSNLVLPTSYLVRCTPLQFYNILKFRAQRVQWPKYAGAFTRDTNYYYFETALMAAKIMIPFFIIVTTYMTAFRDICSMFMGIAVFFFAGYTTPVVNKIPSLFIIGFSFILIAVSFAKFFNYEQSRADYYLDALLNVSNQTAAAYPYVP